MVQKAAALGVGTLAAVSAPTAAAVRLADKLNLNLIGFLRQESCVTYSGHGTLEEVKA
jgi:FdhD protein